MTATLDAVANKRQDKPGPSAEQKLAEDLVARARAQGLSPTGPDGGRQRAIRPGSRVARREDS